MLNLPDEEEMTVAVDTETSGLYVDDGARVSVVSVAWRADDGEIQTDAFPFDQGPLPDKLGKASLFDEQYVAENLGPAEWDELMTWLRRQRLVYHKAKFDLHIIAAGHRVWGRGVSLVDALAWDTKLAQWVLDPTENTSLKPSAERLGLQGGGERDTEAAIKEYLKKAKLPAGRYDLVPWSIIGPYATQDAVLTLLLAENQWERLLQGEDHLAQYIEQEIEMTTVLFGMEQRGIGYDVAGSRKAAYQAAQLMTKLRAEMPFAPSEGEARKWFYGTQAQLPHCVTPGGKSSVKECCVRQLVANGVAGADQYATWSKTKRAVEMWYEGYADKCGPDGRLRTDFNQQGTISMRLSSQRVNLQAMPHDYRLDRIEGVPAPRSFFRAKDDHELWEFDLGQAELRVATKYARCERMRALMESGADVHSETARLIWGSDDFEHRQVAKRANFALIYKVGVRTFIADVEKNTGVLLGEAEAQGIIDTHHQIYPEFPRINGRCERLARQRGWIRLIDGRMRWFRADEYDRIHKAFNQLVQGSIAQFMKQWMLEVDWMMPGTLLLQVHDSLVMEVHRVNADQTRLWMTDNGAALATKLFGIPMIVDAKKWG